MQRKLELFKNSGATKVELVFGEKLTPDPNWVSAIQEKAKKLGIALEIKKIKIHPDGRKEWLPPL